MATKKYSGSTALTRFWTNVKNLLSPCVVAGDSGVVTEEAGSTSYNDLSNKPSINGTTLQGALTSSDLNIDIPTKVSDLTNDSGFITSYTETDPTVPAWAKAANKPSYTANEVGAVATTASQGLTTTQKSNARTNIGAGTSNFSGSYNDLSNKPTIPSKTSDLTNDSGFITSSSIPSVPNITISTSQPTGGSDGDIWFVYS